jgi:hypothetical protein
MPIDDKLSDVNPRPGSADDWQIFVDAVAVGGGKTNETKSEE